MQSKYMIQYDIHININMYIILKFGRIRQKPQNQKRSLIVFRLIMRCSLFIFVYLSVIIMLEFC